MFYKKLIILFVLIVSMFCLTGCSKPDSDAKIKETCIQYLKDKYNEDFTFRHMDTSCNEGSGWVYTVYASKNSNPTIYVTVTTKNGLEIISDDYQIHKKLK